MLQIPNLAGPIPILEGLSFDDVLLVPAYSELQSRTEPDIGTNIGHIKLQLPIISAPMDTVTEANMASFMWSVGGFGIIHRYNSISEQYSHVKWVKEIKERCGVAVGINGDSWDRAEAMVEAGADAIVLDIAHGHLKPALERAEKIKSTWPNIVLISGNVATWEAARDYIEVGVDALRVGIGPGSACTTRLVAGVGVPQITAIRNCFESVMEYGKDVAIISDGGIKTSGDIVKALAAGASSVIIGGLFASFEIAAGRKYYVELDEESPLREMFDHPSKRTVLMKQFRGMASDDALKEYKKGKSYVVEGAGFEIPVTYNHKEVVNSLRDGIITGLSYLGAKNIKELWNKAQFVKVSNAGYEEGTANYKHVGG
jgi:IMP dehydrogenase